MVEEDDIPTGEIPADRVEDVVETPSVQFSRKRPRRIDSDYLFDLRDVVEDIRERDALQVERFEIHEPTPDVLVELMEGGLGTMIPEIILSFFQRVSDGLELEWTYFEDGDTRPGGAIQIMSFGRIFGSWLDELWGLAADDASAADVDFTWELRGLEKVELNGKSMMTVIHIAEEDPTYELYFHDPYGSTHRLDLDVVDYFECLLETRGFFGWQYLVSDVDFDAHPQAAELGRRFHSVMPDLFPDTLYSRYRNPDES